MKVWRVISTEDSGDGTLRWAIEQANSLSKDKPHIKQEIVFQVAPGSSPPRNTDGVSSWYIKLKTPLPVLKTGKLEINTNSSQPVSSQPVLLVADNPNTFPGSLLQIGYPEDRILFSGEGNLPRTDVIIENVHFAQSNAKGENGDQRGQGGGLGAGAAIAHFYGDLEIVHSTFQGLTAQGGNGFAKNTQAGAKNSERGGWVQRSNSNNDRRSFNTNIENKTIKPGDYPLAANYDKALASFDRWRGPEIRSLVIDLQQKQRVASRDATVNGPHVWGTKKDQVSERNLVYYQLYGNDGRAAAERNPSRLPIDARITYDIAIPSQPLFGAGGSEGGRGMSAGGGSENGQDNHSWYNMLIVCGDGCTPYYIRKTRDIRDTKWWSNRRDGLPGGAGSDAGWGGGGGGGGGAGAGESARSGGSGGRSLAYGSNGESGESSTTGYKKEATKPDGSEKRKANWGGLTGSGGKGASLGGAIFSYTSNGNLKLSNVDFIDTKTVQPDRGFGTSSQLGDALFASGTSVSISDVHVDFVKITPESSTDANVFYLDPDAQNTAKVRGYSRDNIQPISGFQEGTSVVFNNAIAYIRPTRLVGRPGVSDQFILNYEQEGSGVKGVQADLQSPNSAFNQIWKKIIPDNEANIRAGKPANMSLAGYLGSLDLLKIGMDAKKNNDIYTAKYGNSTSGLSALKGGLSVGAPMALNLGLSFLSYYQSHQNAVEQYEKDLEENSRNQAELMEYLQDNDGALTVGTVNVRENRTTIVVNDFEIGTDILMIPSDNKNLGRAVDFNEITDQNSGREAVDIVYKTENSTSAPQTFARIILSKEDSERLKSVDNVESFFRSLLVRPQDSGTGGWVLGTSLAKPDIFSNKEYTGFNSNAGLNVIFKEEDSGLPRTQRITATLATGNDQYVGSNYSETVYTRRGDDITAPYAGMDIVFSGNGHDLVTYQQLGASLFIQAEDMPQHDQDNPNGLHATFLTGNSEQLSAIDSAISNFDNVDISGIERQLENYYYSPDSQNHVLDSALLGVEILSLDGVNIVDYSRLESIDNRVGSDYYSLATGSGSIVTGSGSSDLINIKYGVPQHLLLSGFNPYDQLSLVDGGAGLDTLITSFEDAKEFTDSGIRLHQTSGRSVSIDLKDDSSRVLSAKSVERLVIDATHKDDELLFSNALSLNASLFDGDDIVRGVVRSSSSEGNVFVDLGMGDDRAIIQFDGLLNGSATIGFSNSHKNDTNVVQLIDLSAREGVHIRMDTGRDRLLIKKGNSSKPATEATSITINDFNANDRDQLVIDKPYKGRKHYDINGKGLVTSLSIKDSSFSSIVVNFSEPFERSVVNRLVGWADL